MSIVMKCASFVEITLLESIFATSIPTVEEGDCTGVVDSVALS